MIKIKHLIYATLFCSTISLYAIDMNSTEKIIEEASEATKSLQEDFSKLIDTKEPTQEEELNSTTIDNITAQEPIIIVKEGKEDTEIEENITIEKNIVLEESNQTIQEPKKIDIVETNETIQDTLKKTPQIPIDNNSSISDNNTSIIERNTTTLSETNSTASEENQTVVQDSIAEKEEEGSSKKGMMIFKTKLKKICKMTGDEFAKNYTQEDWDDIYDNDEFEKVVYEICPDIKGKYDKKWTNDLYQFSLQYASDSDEIPEC